MAQTTKKAETTQELEARLRALRTLQRTIQENAAEWRADIKRPNEQLSDAERNGRNLEHQIVETTNRLFARTALVESDLLDARRRYFAQVRSAKDDRLSVRKQRELQAGNTLALAALQELCTHQFVFSYDGHKSYSSFEDSMPGHRVCTLCTLEETSAGAPEDIYTTLVEDETRLVRRDLRDKKDLPYWANPEWFPTGYLQQLFEASAGGININWPEAIDKKSVPKA